MQQPQPSFLTLDAKSKAAYDRARAQRGTLVIDSNKIEAFARRLAEKPQTQFTTIIEDAIAGVSGVKHSTSAITEGSLH